MAKCLPAVLSINLVGVASISGPSDQDTDISGFGKGRCRFKADAFVTKKRSAPKVRPRGAIKAPVKMSGRPRYPARRGLTQRFGLFVDRLLPDQSVRAMACQRRSGLIEFTGRCTRALMHRPG
ncbi:hypothetical protein CEXT_761311 [Caerostris extrusa]|uniref:Secreted protein n=1 Tax=Caerostris extrusa TaxID=172846 RepID=A0AAV4SEQ8_CAEEX|nr:hypothetical protein CEXT_761311 [Caerostris extrusa]